MTATLAHIVRHPIKSIGWQELSSVALSAGKVLPFDRHWAIAHSAAAFDGLPDGWQAKRNFVRGVAAAPLMAVTASLSDDARNITLNHPARDPLDIAPDTEAGAAALLDWIAPLWPDTRPAAARVVSAGDQAMTDVPEPYVAVLGLSSLRALGQRLGQELSIHRFRGNLWLDGTAPWEEFDWIGREIAVGTVRLRIEERITRCNATAANPVTGHQDADTLGTLESAYGHRDFGVYATVLNDGFVRTGDAVEVP